MHCGTFYDNFLYILSYLWDNYKLLYPIIIHILGKLFFVNFVKIMHSSNWPSTFTSILCSSYLGFKLTSIGNFGTHPAHLLMTWTCFECVKEMNDLMNNWNELGILELRL
jgi:hypothetical protein